jgi:hypothetical protein
MRANFFSLHHQLDQPDQHDGRGEEEEVNFSTVKGLYEEVVAVRAQQVEDEDEGDEGEEGGPRLSDDDLGDDLHDNEEDDEFDERIKRRKMGDFFVNF